MTKTPIRPTTSSNDDVQYEIDLADTYEVFSQLLGITLVNHQRITSHVKHLSIVLRSEIETYKFACRSRIQLGANKTFAKSAWIDPLVTFQNTMSDSDFYAYFEALLSSWHDIQFRLAGKPEGWRSFPSLLMKALKDENTQRNHLVHSEFTYQPGLSPQNELLMARSQSSSGAKNFGMVSVRTLRKEDLESFVEFQFKLIKFIEIFSWDFEYLLFDWSYIEENEGEFDIEVITFSRSDNVGSGYIEKDSMPQEPTHQEIQELLVKSNSDLTEIDDLRKNLEIKVAQHRYETRFPKEGFVSNIDPNQTIIKLD
jgi:hypothetical protein